MKVYDSILEYMMLLFKLRDPFEECFGSVLGYLGVFRCFDDAAFAPPFSP